MLAELRSRSQITIPAEIIKHLGISEGDKFEVMERTAAFFSARLSSIQRKSSWLWRSC